MKKQCFQKVNGEYTADYLWNEKNIVSFLKVDKGLQDEKKWRKVNERNSRTFKKNYKKQMKSMYLEQK